MADEGIPIVDWYDGEKRPTLDEIQSLNLAMTKAEAERILKEVLYHGRTREGTRRIIEEVEKRRNQ